MAADFPTLQPVDPQSYVRFDEIARGGMGRIIAARDRRLGRAVAIKELLAPNEALRARFEREARITARLQHPATIGVLEAGVWPTGDMFYTMNLIAGRSLDKVITSRPSLEDRFGLIANVIAVADSIAYAHNLGIIHRDLKPANVLVGEFGETVVIDWGLAKDLNEPSGPEPKGTGTGTGTETEVGVVLGTPAYMPPEQAEGAAVDERADVYALGAMLYHVIAGAPPFTGRSSADVLIAVAEGPPPPILERVPTTPPDLATIIETAMAREPSRRFRTAKELAAELKKFQTGQLVGSHRYTIRQLVRRWLVRHRTAVAVAAVAAVLLTVVGVVSVWRVVTEKRTAVAAKRLAEDRRIAAEELRKLAAARGAAAEGLMEFMLGDLFDKLEPLGKTSLLAAAATRARDYYAAQPGLTSADDQDLRVRALAQLGDVMKSQGNGAGAKAQLEAAVELNDRLITTVATSKARQRVQVELLRKLGDITLQEGDLATARRRADAGHAIAMKLAAAEPADPEVQQTLAASHIFLGDVLADADEIANALENYRKATELRRSLVGREATPHNLRELAFALGKVGDMLAHQESFDLALEAEREGLAIRQRLVAEHPDDADDQKSLAVSYGGIGDIFYKQQKLADAAGEIRKARDVLAALSAHDPMNALYLSDLSQTENNVAYITKRLGDLRGARAGMIASEQISERLAAMDRANEAWQADLAMSRANVADLLIEAGEFRAAADKLQDALSIRTKLQEAHPTEDHWRRLVSLAQGDLGVARLKSGDRAGALVAFRTNLAAGESWLAAHPGDDWWEHTVGIAFKNVGVVLLSQHDLPAARAAIEAAITHADKAVVLAPDKAAWAEDAKALRAKLAQFAHRGR